MIDRYNCTRSEMLKKSAMEMPRTYAKTEQAIWIASSLMRWYDEHGQDYNNSEVLDQAVMYVGNGLWPEYRRKGERRRE